MRDKERNTLYEVKECVDDFEYRITDSNRKRKLSHSILILPKKQIYEMDREIDYERRIYRKRPENRWIYLLVTSGANLINHEIYTTYHNLWRIEESFRIIKSELDARLVYLRKKETIT